jgi:hypothetical protein
MRLQEDFEEELIAEIEREKRMGFNLIKVLILEF